MACAPQLVRIPGIQQQRINGIAVGLNAFQLLLPPQPQGFPELCGWMSAFEVAAGVGGFIAMELHHRWRPRAGKGSVNALIRLVRHNPDPLKLGDLQAKLFKDIAPLLLGHVARRPRHADGIGSQRGDRQGLLRIGETADLDGRCGSVIGQGEGWLLSLGSDTTRRDGDQTLEWWWEKAGPF